MGAAIAAGVALVGSLIGSLLSSSSEDQRIQQAKHDAAIKTQRQGIFDLLATPDRGRKAGQVDPLARENARLYDLDATTRAIEGQRADSASRWIPVVTSAGRVAATSYDALNAPTSPNLNPTQTSENPYALKTPDLSIPSASTGIYSGADYLSDPYELKAPHFGGFRV
jgi:hypothetical protein